MTLLSHFMALPLFSLYNEAVMSAKLMSMTPGAKLDHESTGAFT
jgi:hypothetical protein